MNELTEHQIQDQVIGYLRYNGWYVQRMNSGAVRTNYKGRSGMIRMAKAGTPDVMAFRPLPIVLKSTWDVNDKRKDKRHAHLLFVEVKRPKKEPTMLQTVVMRELEDFGARCIVVHSLDELKEQL